MQDARTVAPAIVRRATALLCALVFCVPILATFTALGVGWPLRLASLAIAVLTVVRPFWALLVVIALLPLDTYVWALLSPAFGTESVGEILLAPFLCVSCVKLALASDTRRLRLAPPAVALGLIVAVNGAVVLGSDLMGTWWPDRMLPDFWHHLTVSYFVDRSVFGPVHFVFNWIDGLGLAVVAEWLVAEHRVERDSLVRMFIAGAAAIMLPFWIRLAEISLRTGRPLSAAIGFVRTYRFTPVLSDFNAVGALLAIYLVVLVWLARRRWWCVPLAGGTFGALWLTGSRGALVAAVLTAAALWFLNESSRKMRAAVGVAAIAGVLALVLWNQGRQAQSSSSAAIETRVALAKVGLHITSQNPVFGVGIGQFRRVSRHYISQELIKLFPQTAVGENAHNNFIQILAELGLIGLAGFVWLIVAFAPTIRGATADDFHAGLAGGIGAFLLSCLVSHPLLIAEVAWLFMLALGIATGFGRESGVRSHRWQTRVAAAAAVCLAIALPVRLWAIRQTADLSGLAIGARAASEVADGVEYRGANQKSAWFFPSTARIIDIPLRVTPQSDSSCLVDIEIDGHPANTVRAFQNEWSMTRITVPAERRSPRSRRLILQAGSDRCHLMVGRFTYHE